MSTRGITHVLRDTTAVSLTCLPEFRGLRPLNAPAKRAYPRSARVDDMRHSAAIDAVARADH